MLRGCWSVSRLNWSLFFGINVWALWKLRNDDVLGDRRFVGGDKVLLVNMMVRNFCVAADSVFGVMENGPDGLLFRPRWLAPSDGWFKINVDASVRNGGKEAAGRGVFRDSNGEFILNFHSRVAIGEVSWVELWSI